MHSHENQSGKKNWQHTPSTTPNPFQIRSFGIQAKSEQSSSPQGKVEAKEERAKPYGINLLNIPIHAPGTEPPPPIQTKLTKAQLGDKYGQEVGYEEELGDYAPGEINLEDMFYLEIEKLKQKTDLKEIWEILGPKKTEKVLSKLKEMITCSHAVRQMIDTSSVSRVRKSDAHYLLGVIERRFYNLGEVKRAFEISKNPESYSIESFQNDNIKYPEEEPKRYSKRRKA